MTYHYEDWLTQSLNLLKQDLSIDLNIEVYEEQIFSKKMSKEKLTPRTLYVVIKYLSSTITAEATTQPVQIMILSEENSLNASRMLFTEFANKYNWALSKEDTVYVKHQYSTPVVLNNFQSISIGYRSMLYVSGTLQIIENSYDVSNFKIDNQDIQLLSFNMTYTMSSNTQQKSGSTNELATSVKSVSTLSFGIIIPFKKNYNCIAKILNIMKGALSGNSNFNVSFQIGDIIFNFNLKLVSSIINTAPNAVPAISLGFQV